MTRKDLIGNIARKGSFLCVGLDPDIKKIPAHLLTEENPLLAFNKAIIDATAPYCVAFKPNLAFFIQTSSLSRMPSVETSAILRLCMPARFSSILTLTPLRWPRTWAMIP